MKLLNSSFKSACQDKIANLQVIGCLLRQPNLLRRYELVKEDFEDILVQTIFTIIQRMARASYKSISIDELETALEQASSKGFAIYSKNNQGREYCRVALEEIDDPEKIMARQYPWVKKYSILRMLAQHTDISDFFVPPTELETDEAKRQRQDKLAEIDYTRLLDYCISKMKSDVKLIYRDPNEVYFKAGTGDFLDQLEKWETESIEGYNYPSKFLNTATNGICKGKFKIFSAGSGVGKTRTTISNMCFSFASEFYKPGDNGDAATGSWECNPNAERKAALYIGTEMDLTTEVLPIILGYIAWVDTDHIMHPNHYLKEWLGGGKDDLKSEKNRVIRAFKSLHLNYLDSNGLPKCGDFKGGIYLASMPDYSVSTLRNQIEQTMEDTDYNLAAVFLDYLMPTDGLVAEYKKITSLGQVQEYQVLNYLSRSLKDMANEYQINIDTCTQLSGNINDPFCRDQSLIRGSKGIIDKCDVAGLLFKPTKSELVAALKVISKHKIDSPIPNRYIQLYKNRGGTFNDIRIWFWMDIGREDEIVGDDMDQATSDLIHEANSHYHKKKLSYKGTGRIIDCFVTESARKEGNEIVFKYVKIKPYFYLHGYDKMYAFDNKEERNKYIQTMIKALKLGEDIPKPEHDVNMSKEEEKMVNAKYDATDKDGFEKIKENEFDDEGILY